MPLPFRERVRRGGLPVLLAPLAVIAAAALVAAASRAHGGFHGGVGPGPTRSFADQLFTVTLVMMGVGIAGWIYVIFVRRDLIELPNEERRRRNVYVSLAFVLAIAAFAMLAKEDRLPRPPPAVPPPSAATALGDPPETRREARPDRAGPWAPELGRGAGRDCPDRRRRNRGLVRLPHDGSA